MEKSYSADYVSAQDRESAELVRKQMQNMGVDDMGGEELRSFTKKKPGPHSKYCADVKLGT